MDIHKPKPVHSLREFVSEIAVVVCGILIAIGLEQTVETVHAREETAALDRTLRVEIKRDLGEALQEAATFYCVRAQTATAIRWLAASDRWPGARPARPGLTAADYADQVFQVAAAPDAGTIPNTDHAGPQAFSPGGAAPKLIPSPRSAMSDAAWLAAASTPALLHMDQRRRDFYALIYFDVQHVEQAIDDGIAVRYDLAALAAPQTLSPEERRRYIERFTRLDGDSRSVAALTGLMMAMAAKNGIRPDEKDVQDRLNALRTGGYGGCVKPFLIPPKSLQWADKFEADRQRFGAGAE